MCSAPLKFRRLRLSPHLGGAEILCILAPNEIPPMQDIVGEGPIPLSGGLYAMAFCTSWCLRGVSRLTDSLSTHDLYSQDEQGDCALGTDCGQH
jgi:hypothetical protein